jgi:hypothetical protein
MPTSGRITFFARSSVLLVLALGLTMLLAWPAGVAQAGGAAGDGGDTDPPPKSVQVPIRRAGVVLARAEANLKTHRPAAAAGALGLVRRYVARAHRAGLKQISAPPSDPESDVTPGPVSVVAVLDMEHAVVVRTARMLDGLTVGIGVGKTLTAAMSGRMRMLNRITSLDPEGAGGDYDDDMADTLEIYTAEVTYLTAVLANGRLTAGSRNALQTALLRSKQTLAKVEAAWGGGE